MFCTVGSKNNVCEKLSGSLLLTFRLEPQLLTAGTAEL